MTVPFFCCAGKAIGMRYQLATGGIVKFPAMLTETARAVTLS
jgi:hypothetical protein